MPCLIGPGGEETDKSGGTGAWGSWGDWGNTGEDEESAGGSDWIGFGWVCVRTSIVIGGTGGVSSADWIGSGIGTTGVAETVAVGSAGESECVRTLEPDITLSEAGDKSADGVAGVATESAGMVETGRLGSTGVDS